MNALEGVWLSFWPAWSSFFSFLLGLLTRRSLLLCLRPAEPSGFKKGDSEEHISKRMEELQKHARRELNP